jgi:hypothetical protein
MNFLLLAVFVLPAVRSFVNMHLIKNKLPIMKCENYDGNDSNKSNKGESGRRLEKAV